MKLFDEVERHDCEPAKYSEPQFTFLNRTGRANFDRVRQELEKWFSHYPASGQAELRSRFRSAIDSQHQAAFFELFLYEMLLRFGCNTTLHPNVPETTRTPDFLAEAPSGERFYIEATLTRNESALETAAQARTNAVYDLLNGLIDSSNFFLSLSIEGNPTTQPPVKRMASFLNARLAELDPDHILNLYRSGEDDAVPKWLFEHEGWKVKFIPIPKKPEARNKPSVRPIGALSYGFHWADDWTAIRDAITGKAGRYRGLDLPYIVAVDILHHPDEIDIMEALFGKEQFTITFDERGPSESVEPRPSRIPNGAWTSQAGPRYTRVSAVLLATQLSPWNIPRASLRLYHNPWAQKVYKSVLTQLPQAVPVQQENRMRNVDGQSNDLIFGLHPLWPNSDG
jgi:hypothetical protein